MLSISFLASRSTVVAEARLFDDGGGGPGGVRAGVIAFAVALLVHVLLYLMMPEHFYPVPLGLSQPDTIELELETAVEEQVDPEQLRFVEANPEAPENTPDRKDQYSFRNTQAADESPEASLLEAPKVEGQEASQKIIDGRLEQAVVMPSVVGAGVVSPTAGSDDVLEGDSAVLPAAPRLPTAEFIRQSELPEDEAGSSPVKKDAENFSMEKIQEDAPVALHRNPEPAERLSGGLNGNPEVKPVPQARPRLSPELLTGPVMQSHGSASRRGALSIDATFSEFGEYEQQFYAALQLGWYQEIEFHQPIDTASTVAVRFTMHSDGTIHEIHVLHSNASELASFLCESALAKRSPFRSWTKEMIAVFGSERTLTVRFNYR